MMGCDIHMHTEVKINDKWEHHSAPNIQRWYNLFSKMAGVRNGDDIKPISEPKGFPEDISNITKIDVDFWGIDAHSHSFLNAKEIPILEAWMEDKYKKMDGHNYVEKEWGYLFGNSWGNFEKYRESYPSEIEDVRFVFWFDN